nr:unnamed protein product [Digitaria exilis]
MYAAARSAPPLPFTASPATPRPRASASSGEPARIRPPSRPRRAAWGGGPHRTPKPPHTGHPHAQTRAQPPRRASLAGRPLERIEAGRAAPEWLGFGGAAELAPPNAQRRD